MFPLVSVAEYGRMITLHEYASFHGSLFAETFTSLQSYNPASAALCGYSGKGQGALACSNWLLVRLLLFVASG